MIVNDRTLERASELFGALASPLRLKIVELVMDEPKSVGQLAELLKVSQPAASQNLAILARTGVLEVQRKGASRFYGIRGPRIPRILELIEEFCRTHSLYGTSEEGENA